jgi:tripartite-type tricarboxylate transporter receptor subunit TctC
MKNKTFTIFSATQALALCLALSVSGIAGAQTYPDKPVRLLHGFIAGGNADAVARIVATELAKNLGQAIVVEPKPGAGGTIAAAAVSQAKPDGYTLLLATGGHSIGGVMFEKLPYDTAKSFQAISALTSFPFLVVVNASSPYSNLSDMLKAGKAGTKPLTFGSAGLGTGQHMTGELLAQRSATPATHVPYRGESAAITAILSNEVDFILVAPTAAVSHVKSGKLRALAASGNVRWPGLPDVKTVAEQGVPGFEVRSWTALLAPANTPQPVIERLNSQVRLVLQDPALRARLVDATGGDVQASSPQELQTAIEGDLKRWAQLVKDANIQRN